MSDVVAGPAAWVGDLLRAAVGRVAATELDPTDPFRGLYVSDDAAVVAAAEADGAALGDRVEVLARAAGIDDQLDVAILALCAAPDLDARFGRLLGYLHDDVARSRASPRLVARLLADAGADPGAVLARLDASAPLRAWGVVRLLDGDAALPVADRLLALDAPAVAVLLGADLDGADRDGPRIVEPLPWPPGHDAAVAQVRALIGDANVPPLALVGPDAAAVLTAALGAPAVVLRAARLAEPAAAGRARLVARLRGVPVLAVDGVEDVPEDAAAALRAAVRAATPPPVLLAATDRGLEALEGLALTTIALGPLDAAERRRAWSQAAPGADAAELAARFTGSASAIAAVAEAAGPAPAADDLRRAARAQSRRAIGPLATRLDGTARWEDLVLPDADLAALRSIAAFIAHRERVVGEWGFGALRGAPRGLTALFSGPSGTGKTLAARVLGEELGVEAYRIDLSAIVSKYIGETEKHLDRIFAVAGSVGALLVFDEADALFGRRSAVTDARDRYANLEVAYLLQRLETHDGAAILTTNLRQNLDAAFLRRFDYAIEFTPPSPEHRAELWRRHLPAAAPLAADVDVAALARHDLSGGSIATCARVAAFTAAASGTIAMADLEAAVTLEQRKLGRLAAAR